MLTKCYYLEFTRYKSRNKTKDKHKLGSSNRTVRVPFWVSPIDVVIESTKEVESELTCYAYLKRIERIK